MKLQVTLDNEEREQDYRERTTQTTGKESPE